MTNFEIERQEARNIYNIGSIDEAHLYSLNADEIAESFDKWWQQKQRQYLHILVLASTQEQVQASSFAEIADRYGELSEDWKPFLHETSIKELLLVEYAGKAKIPLIVSFVDKVTFTNPNQKDEFLRKTFPNIVLITDGIALAQSNKLTPIYNNNRDKGNLIFPMCRNLPASICEAIRKEVGEALEDIAYRFHENFEVDASRYELEVPTKALLFRRLTNMARKNLLLTSLIPVAYSTKTTSVADDLSVDMS